MTQLFDALTRTEVWVCQVLPAQVLLLAIPISLRLQSVIKTACWNR